MATNVTKVDQPAYCDLQVQKTTSHFFIQNNFQKPNNINGNNIAKANVDHNFKTQPIPFTNNANTTNTVGNNTFALGSNSLSYQLN